MNPKLTVVYDEKTKKLFPFTYDKSGCVVVLSSGNVENYIVSNVDASRIDLANGYLLDEGECYEEE